MWLKIVSYSYLELDNFKYSWIYLNENSLQKNDNAIYSNTFSKTN
jgi:hypothetical protein